MKVKSDDLTGYSLSKKYQLIFDMIFTPVTDVSVELKVPSGGEEVRFWPLLHGRLPGGEKNPHPWANSANFDCKVCSIFVGCAFFFCYSIQDSNKTSPS